jgi:hypothetical protein
MSLTNRNELYFLSPGTLVSSTNKTDCHDITRYNWNSVESGIKYHKPNLYFEFPVMLLT